jgi:large subunit ribosomal protein L30
LSRLRVEEGIKMKKVTLVKSLIACKPNQKATAQSLGLVKIGDSIVHEDNAVLNGKIKVISHLVKVENA